MSTDPLLVLSAERRAFELRRVAEREAAELAFERARRRVIWQCVALSFLGVPVYAVSWGMADPRTSQLLAATGFFISYAVPYFRWLAYHVRNSDEFQR